MIRDAVCLLWHKSTPALRCRTHEFLQPNDSGCDWHGVNRVVAHVVSPKRVQGEATLIKSRPLYISGRKVFTWHATCGGVAGAASTQAPPESIINPRLSAGMADANILQPRTSDQTQYATKRQGKPIDTRAPRHVRAQPCKLSHKHKAST